ncbi:MAG: type IV pilus twitching motility protein PilT [Phycisphaerales bacterium]
MTHPVEHQPISTDHAEQRVEQTRLRKFLEAAIKHKASDLIVKAGAQARIRLRGELRALDAQPFTQQELEEAAMSMFSQAQREHFKLHGSVDMAYDFDADNRFRMNVFQTRGRISLAARRVSSEILSYEQLHLPPILTRIAEARQGLVLLAGITGSGKSTTIASMLQQINETRPCHIVTIEDPIEFILKDAKSLINQREVGVDVPDFAEALRALVRETPDVVLVGEMRDRETFEAAVHAAETGHLVFGTIHASSAPQAFGRIYNLFPPEERDLIRDLFSKNLQAIIYQKLLPTIRNDIPRVPAVEVLVNGPVVEKYISDGREAELGDVIRSAQSEGMIDFTSCLVQLVEKEYIHPRVALANAHNPDELKMRLKGIKTGTG